MNQLIKLFLLCSLMPSLVVAATVDDEIAYLLSEQRSSDCTFIRNDISYTSREFQRHLQSKLRQNNELISSAEDFIEKIATRSAASNSPYVALCDGELKFMQEWFTELLMAYRRSN